MGAVDIALAAAQSRRRRRPDPIADIAAAVASGAGTPASIIGAAISDGVRPGLSHAVASPTYDPRSIASRRESAFPERVRALRSTAPRPGERKRPARRTTAQKRLAVAVPEIVPPQYRKAVAKQGQRLNTALKAAGSPLSGPEYLAKLIQFESGWNPKAYNPSSATGLGQFIDSTAEDFRSRLGVKTQDPSRPRQMIKGASMHASGKFGYNPLYAGYNPGYSSTDPIPSVDSGANVKVKVPRKAVRKIADGQATSGAVAKPVKVPGLIKIGKKAERKFDVEAREQPFFDPVDPVHSTNSMHYSGDAIDFQGSADQLASLNKWLARKYGSQTDEMFYDPGINIADGQETSAIGGHPTHVHFGLSPENVGERASSVYGVGSDVSVSGGTAPMGSGADVANGIMGAATQDRNRAQSTYRRTGPLSTTPFAARALTPAERKRLKDEEERDPETGLPIEKRYAPRRRTG